MATEKLETLLAVRQSAIVGGNRQMAEQYDERAREAYPDVTISALPWKVKVKAKPKKTITARAKEAMKPSPSSTPAKPSPAPSPTKEKKDSKSKPAAKDADKSSGTKDKTSKEGDN